MTTTAGTPAATTITETGTMPAGITLHDNGNGTATLAGTPTNTGVFQVTITASNGIAPNATPAFTLTVTPNVIGLPHDPPGPKATTILS